MVKARKFGFTILVAILFAVVACAGVPQALAVGGEEDVDVSVDTPITMPTDIVDNWAYAQISSLINQGIASGYPDGTFKPDNTVTRAEFIVMINKAFGFNLSQDINYTDVKPDYWAYNDLKIAAAAGYIAGFEDGSMKPDSPVNREQAAVILAKVLVLDTSASKILPYTDAQTIGAWSLNSISALFDAGLISGYPDGTFQPTNPITRAEAAVLIAKGLTDWVPIDRVSLERNTLTLQVGGKSQTIFVMIYPANASDKAVIWTSDNPDIATVSDAGYITPVAPGECTITVTSHQGGKTDTCALTVTQ